VTLDLVVRAFNRGATAEEIAWRYPALNLVDVYEVLGSCLKHQTDLDAYLKSRPAQEAPGAALEIGETHPSSRDSAVVTCASCSKEQAETLRQSHPEWSPAGLRDCILARRNSR